VGSGCGVTRRRRYFAIMSEWAYSGQICLTFSNAKVSVNLAILHPLTINCRPVSCIYDWIRQILSLIISILGNICRRRRLPHHVTFLSLHSRDQRKPTFCYIIIPTHLATSCCSTDSERPHRCRHLPNYFVSRRTFPVLHIGSEYDNPKIAHFSRRRIHTPNGISIGSAISAKLMVVINRHTDTHTGLRM